MRLVACNGQRMLATAVADAPVRRDDDGFHALEGLMMGTVRFDRSGILLELLLRRGVTRRSSSRP